MNSKKPHLMRQLIFKNKRYFGGALVFTLAAVVIDFITPVLLAETLDIYIGAAGENAKSHLPGFMQQIVEGLGGKDYMSSHLWMMGLVLVALSVLGGLFSYFKGRWQAVAGENISMHLREQLYDHVQHLPFSYHVKAETGDLIQRCTSDVETVRRFLSGQLLNVFNCVLSVAVAVFYMVREDLTVALFSMIMVPGLFFFAWLFFKWVSKTFKDADEAEGKMSNVLQEDLTGVRVVRAFGKQEDEVEKFDGVSSDYRKKNFKICRLLAVYWAGGDLLSMTQSMITLLVCVYFACRGVITVGTVTIFTTYVWKLVWPIRQLGRILSDAGKSGVALKRISEVLTEPAEPEEPDAVKPSLKGDIVFDDVSFGYEEGRDVLSHMSFTIPAGKTVAILGATGSGKSTVVQLLQRLFAPKSGRITIGGEDIQQIDRIWLRSRVGLILQEPFLFSRTLKDNVTIAAADPSEQEIEAAVNDAAAKEFILSSDKGWDTLVGEKGVTLSGGQKQRVAIARTLMKENDILIFDDSLSAVDTETDAQIRHALKQRSQDTTTIIISHRVVTLSQADLILVMEDGRVTQQGTHEELMSVPGLYSRIFNIQSALEDEFREDNQMEVPASSGACPAIEKAGE
ncbi:MAG: ABC transporter ATP-binding protein [Clostridiales bacterium]|nr:ABC transporter ATP-binding protein [Clostridiales bacterium]